ncbi:MAG: hypothetical protein N3C12_13655 [Candidatus Binatia bacterium]|nr:hypothetical protein [Candidatus Binatia bacterium]
MAVVATLGYFTLTILKSPPTEEPLPPDLAAVIEFEGFSARLESTTQQRTLRVSIRVRNATARPIDAQVFFVAKGDRSNGALLSVWPTLSPSGPFSPAGHIRGGPVSTGTQVRLTQNWQRITGEVPIPAEVRHIHTVTIYIFGPRGEVLLSRPFELRTK